MFLQLVHASSCCAAVDFSALVREPGLLLVQVRTYGQDVIDGDHEQVEVEQELTMHACL